MPTDEVHKLLGRIVADAADERLDDAVFRRRTARAARQLQGMLEPHRHAARPRAGAVSTRNRLADPSMRQPRYRYIAVPNGVGGTTSVSLSNSVFEELARAMGGPAKVTEQARKVAASHKPDSGMSRSAYVLRRLRQRASRAGP